MAEGEAPQMNVGVGDLRGIVVDSDELQKGTRLFDDKGLMNLARHGSKLFCEAKGSGPAPYRVSLSFGGAGALDVKARCTCPAARSRSFCKHAAALLVAWARAPEAFVESAPPGASGEAKKKAVKRGSAAAADLMKQGAAQIVTLVRELGVAGVAAMGDDRAPQVKTLGENLREYKLRRLSAKTLDLAILLEAAAERRGSLPAVVYTDLCADLLLTARKLEKHLTGGEPLDDRHVEELVGKTWQKADRRPIAGLDLLEYAYVSRVTSDEFVIRESRFIDLASGAHYSEKQIVPGFLARSTDPKPSRGGAVLAGVRGSTYPSYPPTRLEVADLGDARPVDHAALARLVEKALPDVGAALAALSEHRRDVFAPDLLPAAIRVETLFARAGRMQAVDAAGDALHLPDDRALDGPARARRSAGRGSWRSSATWASTRRCRRSGRWRPSSTGPLGLELRALTAPEGAKPRAAAPVVGSAAWADAARAAGASSAAIALAEVREELADAFAVGLATLGAARHRPAGGAPPRPGAREAGVAAPRARRARGPRGQARRLRQALPGARHRAGAARGRDDGRPRRDGARADVRERLRRPPRALAGAARDRRGARPGRARPLRGGRALRPPLRGPAPRGARGEHLPHVGRRERRALRGPRLRDRGGRPARGGARRGPAGPRGQARARRQDHGAPRARRGRRARGRARSSTRPPRTRRTSACARSRPTPSTRWSSAPSGPRRCSAGARPRCRRWPRSRGVLASAPTKDAREAAVHALVELGHLSAIPALRQAFLTDTAQDVRREAALALALLGDTEMVDVLVDMLARRGESDRDAKIAADALGRLGDVRGLRELLAAYAEGYKPAVIGEALRAMGPVAIVPLIELIEAHPHLADRRAALSVLEQLPDQDLAATLTARLSERAGSAGFAELGGALPQARRGAPLLPPRRRQGGARRDPRSRSREGAREGGQEGDVLILGDAIRERASPSHPRRLPRAPRRGRPGPELRRPGPHLLRGGLQHRLRRPQQVRPHPDQ